jgi:hypothetical protein
MAQRIFTRGSFLNFGKHKGETIESLIKSDPAYLVWCYDNVEGFMIVGVNRKELYKAVLQQPMISCHTMPHVSLFGNTIKTFEASFNKSGGIDMTLEYDGDEWYKNFPPAQTGSGKFTGPPEDDEDNLSKCRCGGGMGGCICGEYDLPGGFSGGM